MREIERGCLDRGEGEEREREREGKEGKSVSPDS